ncbi:MAG: hypothetical protein AAF533_27530 [Acidobacteriota bacterium]
MLRSRLQLVALLVLTLAHPAFARGRSHACQGRPVTKPDMLNGVPRDISDAIALRQRALALPEKRPTSLAEAAWTSLELASHFFRKQEEEAWPECLEEPHVDVDCEEFRQSRQCPKCFRYPRAPCERLTYSDRTLAAFQLGIFDLIALEEKHPDHHGDYLPPSGPTWNQVRLMLNNAANGARRLGLSRRGKHPDGSYHGSLYTRIVGTLNKWKCGSDDTDETCRQLLGIQGCRDGTRFAACVEDMVNRRLVDMQGGSSDACYTYRLGDTRTGPGLGVNPIWRETSRDLIEVHDLPSKSTVPTAADAYLGETAIMYLWWDVMETDSGPDYPDAWTTPRGISLHNLGQQAEIHELSKLDEYGQYDSEKLRAIFGAEGRRIATLNLRHDVVSEYRNRDGRRDGGFLRVEIPIDELRPAQDGGWVTLQVRSLDERYRATAECYVKGRDKRLWIRGTNAYVETGARWRNYCHHGVHCTSVMPIIVRHDFPLLSMQDEPFENATRLEITPDPIKVCAGDCQQLVTRVHDTDGHFLGSTQPEWSVSSDVAVMDGDCLRGCRPGHGTVRAKIASPRLTARAGFEILARADPKDVTIGIVNEHASYGRDDDSDDFFLRDQALDERHGGTIGLNIVGEIRLPPCYRDDGYRLQVHVHALDPKTGEPIDGKPDRVIELEPPKAADAAGKTVKLQATWDLRDDEKKWIFTRPLVDTYLIKVVLLDKQGKQQAWGSYQVFDLIQRHRPLLYLEQEERWPPMSVEGFLQNPEPDVCDCSEPRSADDPVVLANRKMYCIDGGIACIKAKASGQGAPLDVAALARFDGDKYYLSHDLDEIRDKTQEDVVLYYHSAWDPDESTAYLQYWALEVLSLITTQAGVHFGHQGDWEMMQVTVQVDAENPEPSKGVKPLAATYSSHYFGITKPWTSLGHRKGHRPPLYVAYGAHASYPAFGYYDTHAGCDPMHRAGAKLGRDYLLDPKRYEHYELRWLDTAIAFNRLNWGSARHFLSIFEIEPWLTVVGMLDLTGSPLETSVHAAAGYYGIKATGISGALETIAMARDIVATVSGPDRKLSGPSSPAHRTTSPDASIDCHVNLYSDPRKFLRCYIAPEDEGLLDMESVCK